MMNYEMFVEELKNKISVAINIPIENIEFSKDGDRFSPTGDRLLVKFAEHDDAYEVCGLHTKELFREFLNGTSFDTILDSTVRDIRQLQGQNSYEKTKKIWNYETVKDSLFIRLLNYDDNSKELSNAVYKRIGDIAQVLYMKVSECDGNIMSTNSFDSCIDDDYQWHMNNIILFKADEIIQDEKKESKETEPEETGATILTSKESNNNGHKYSDEIYEELKDYMYGPIPGYGVTSDYVGTSLEEIIEDIDARPKYEVFKELCNYHGIAPSTVEYLYESIWGKPKDKTVGYFL